MAIQAARSCRLGGRAMPAACKTLPTWPAGGAGGDALPSFSNGRLLKAVEVAQQVAPSDKSGPGGGTHQNRLKIDRKIMARRQGPCLLCSMSL